MPTFYEEMQAVASSVLAEFDQKRPGDADPASNGVYYVRVTPGDGPDDDPGEPTETPFKLDAAVRGVSFKYVDNSLIVATDLQLTCAVRSDVTPEMNGFIKVDGVSHKIIRIINKPAAGTPVAHTIVFRR